MLKTVYYYHLSCESDNQIAYSDCYSDADECIKDGRDCAEKEYGDYQVPIRVNIYSQEEEFDDDGNTVESGEIELYDSFDVWND